MQLTDRETIIRLLHIYGSEKIFFGSDYPMWDAKDELEILRSLPLKDFELDNILYRNFDEFISRF